MTATYPTVVAETGTAWWTCPDWCATCEGGDTLHWSNGGTTTHDRVHTRDLGTTSNGVTVTRICFEGADGRRSDDIQLTQVGRTVLVPVADLAGLLAGLTEAVTV